MMRYPQVTSLRSDYPRLLLRVASPMPLLDFSFFVGNFLNVRRCPISRILEVLHVHREMKIKNLTHISYK